MSIFLMVPKAEAGVAITGDVNPATDPSTWGNYSTVSIGISSEGAVSITDGSSLNDGRDVDIGSYGEVTIDGNGSTWLYPNFKVLGKLSITNGGYSDGYSGQQHIGWGTYTNGAVTVDGQGSEWFARSTFYIGWRNSRGTLTITNGGSVSSPSAFWGNNSWGEAIVNVDGEGSSLTISSQTQMGKDDYYSGVCHMDITNGGSVDTGSTSLENGTVMVDGVGSSWAYGTLSSYGTITISNRARMEGYLSKIYKGTITLDGEGTAWDNNNDLRLGMSYYNMPGTGLLKILNNSTVSVTGFTEIGEHGAIAFGSHGGVLTTGTLRFDSDQISGSGTIHTSGLVGDLDIVFDDSLGNQQTFFINGATLNLTIDGTSELGAGYRDDGTITIKDRAIVNTNTGILGYYTSTGTAIVTGPGSAWINNDYLAVGYNGTGVLTITNGGLVTNESTRIGYLAAGMGYLTADSIGKVLVNGEGSTLASRYLFVGNAGTAFLSIANGGLASATDNLVINSRSKVTIDVGHGSALRSGTEENYHNYGIKNDGVIRLVAGAGVPPGSYTPLLCWGLTGRGSVQALGGQWDSTALTMTVGDAINEQGDGGASAVLDLAVNQQIMITDSLSGKSVKASLSGAGSSTNITFTATVVTGNDLSSLESLVSGTGQEILSAWDLFIDGYTVSEDSPVYLSLPAESADDNSSFTIWHLADGEWVKYETPDLSFDGASVSFVAESFSGYAVTRAVQTEPCAGDFDEDGDVDGMDLYSLISTENEITTADFSSVFGKNDCL